MMNDEMNKQLQSQYLENQVIYEKIRGLQEDVELHGENTLEYLSMRDGFFENIIWSLQKHLGIIFDEEGMIKVNGDEQYYIVPIL
jgi:hypothetical protein